MIISASYRTDIPAFHGAWFARRLDAGWVDVRNPYGGPPSRISLEIGAVDGFVFWTRNARPFLPQLDRVAKRGDPFIIHYTVTGLPASLDGGTPAPNQALAVMEEITRAHGPGRLVWRYDPIVLSRQTPALHHRETFARLADRIASLTLTDEVVVSFLQPYKKAIRRLDKVAGLGWIDPPLEAKQSLLAELAGLAADRGLRVSLCAQPDLLVPGVTEAACVDAARLSRIAGRPIAPNAKPHRPTCACAQSRDIGAYDTCAHGCVYCYAVNGQARARTLVAGQDPEAIRLGS
ncbi:MAG: DUF1848 domain-containing protein [Rhodospirillum sp.]|nr:DUF1848 domain-containing protein [Rhodospirillum sp.]MCF8487653.1 DUF1848 domain-containing protein [Rhodospirillum sp.]MCF8502744.1 DUF1848 domain-containing protein [Rhodospirillum sp.]